MLQRKLRSLFQMINKLSRSCWNQDINCSFDIQYGSPAFSRSHATITFDHDSMGQVDAVVVLSVASTSSIGSNSHTVRLHCSCKNLIAPRLPRIPFSNPTLAHIAQAKTWHTCFAESQLRTSTTSARMQRTTRGARAFKTGMQNARRNVFPDPVSAATQTSQHCKTWACRSDEMTFGITRDWLGKMTCRHSFKFWTRNGAKSHALTTCSMGKKVNMWRERATSLEVPWKERAAESVVWCGLQWYERTVSCSSLLVSGSVTSAVVQ